MSIDYASDGQAQLDFAIKRIWLLGLVKWQGQYAWISV